MTNPETSSDLDWRNAKLPCDVSLPPATVIRAGCTVETLLTGLRARGMVAPPAEAATTIERLTAERDGALNSAIENAEVASDWSERALAAESLAARQAEALNWAMDEIDVLSNKLNDFAYPQGMAMVGRRDQLDNYRKAVDARRAGALATESSNG